MYRDIPIVEGEYCARTTETCIGSECGDYGIQGCKLYKKRVKAEDASAVS